MALREVRRRLGRLAKWLAMCHGFRCSSFSSVALPMRLESVGKVAVTSDALVAGSADAEEPRSSTSASLAVK